jgi:hypothetical protein
MASSQELKSLDNKLASELITQELGKKANLWADHSRAWTTGLILRYIEKGWCGSAGKDKVVCESLNPSTRLEVRSFYFIFS